MRDELHQQLRQRVDRFLKSHEEVGPPLPQGFYSTAARPFSRDDQEAVNCEVPGWYFAAGELRERRRIMLIKELAAWSVAIVVPASLAILAAGIFLSGMHPHVRFALEWVAVVLAASAMTFAIWAWCYIRSPKHQEFSRLDKQCLPWDPDKKEILHQMDKHRRARRRWWISRSAK